MVHIIGKSKQYKTKKDCGILPDGLEGFIHTLPWPIDKTTANLHLSCYFGEANYSSPASFPFRPSRHRGVDMQVNAGISVLAPEKSRAVFFCCDRRRENLANVILLGTYSEITYNFVHLDVGSIPKKIKERTNVDVLTDTIVDCGERIGAVGKWPYELTRNVKIPEEVKKIYGASYNHLHFETHYYPCTADDHVEGLLMGWDISNKQFNPLLVLEDLAK